MDGKFHRARVTCAHCGNLNTITASLLTPTSLVRCSNCHSELGQWQKIVAESDQSAETILKPQD